MLSLLKNWRTKFKPVCNSCGQVITVFSDPVAKAQYEARGQCEECQQENYVHQGEWD